MTADMAKRCPNCNPYPYRHDGPPVHRSKLADFLVSEANLREDRPDLFEDDKKAR